MDANKTHATFDIDGLYQQLKDLDALDRSIIQVSNNQQLRKFGIETDPEVSIVHDCATSSLRKIVEELRFSLRKTINIYSRPNVRPLSILDLPDELLRHTFGFLRTSMDSTDFFLSDMGCGLDDLKNARLTCRRFCITSSYNLIHHAHIDLSASSLSKLEAISCHPALSRGVRSIRIDLDFYSPVFANDIEQFADYYAREMDNVCSYIQRCTDCEEPALGTLDDQFQRKEFARVAKQIKKVLISWDRYSNSGTPEDLVGDDVKEYYTALLIQAHLEYKIRFETQEKLREDGTLVRSLATAIARMPNATKLEFRDSSRSLRKHSGRANYWGNLDDALRRNLLLPTTWQNAIDHELGPPPAELITKIPGAIHKAGGVIAGLAINVSAPEKYDVLVPSSGDLEELKGAVQKLKVFEFDPEIVGNSVPWEERDRRDMEDFGKFLGAFLDTKTIETLRINLGRDETYFPSLLNFGHLINVHPWPKLRIVSWIGVSIHLADLERFMGQVDKPLVMCAIENVELLSGSWADGLDILRRTSRNSLGTDFTFHDPWGGELEHLTEEEMKLIFSKSKLGSFNLAEGYLRGWNDQNPLMTETVDQDLEEEEEEEGEDYSANANDEDTEMSGADSEQGDEDLAD